MDKLEMSRRQEATLAEAIGGRLTKGSGSQWTDQTDVRNNRLDVEFAFAVECKSTGGQSIAVDRKMLAKVIEQAGNERPALALRIYEGNERYDVLYDWVAFPLADAQEMIEKLNHAPLALLQQQDLSPEQLEKFREQFEAAQASGEPVRVREPDGPTMEQHRELMGQYAQAEAARRDLEARLAVLQQMITSAEAESPLAMAVSLGAAQNTIHFQRQVIGALQAQVDAGSGRRNELQHTMAAPPPLRLDGTPRLPWTVVFKDTKADGTPQIHLVHYDATGVMTTREIARGSEVRVENTIGQQQAMFVDGARIRAGQLYVDGVLRVTVDPDSPLNSEEPGNPLDQS